MRKKKILYFVTEDWYFYSHRLPIAKAAKRDGFEVVVVTRCDKHSELIKKEGFKLIPVGLKRQGKNIINELKLLIEIIKIYKKEKPDIVHHVAIKPVLYGSIAAFFIGKVSVVNALAGLGLIFSSKEKKNVLLKFLLKIAFKISYFPKNTFGIFQNPEDLLLFNNANIVNKNRSVLIKGSGVDINIYENKPEPEDVKIILASRMIWDKGVEEFVKASQILKEKGYSIECLLIGKPDDANPNSIPIDTLNKWNNDGNVKWLGYQSNMSKIISNSNIVVLPTSYGEGVPKVLIEAASCGRPIITTDTPGCREIVQNGINGILVKPKCVDEIVEALEILIDDPNLRKLMGNNGREIVEKEFSEEIVVAKTIKLYRKLVGI